MNIRNDKYLSNYTEKSNNASNDQHEVSQQQVGDHNEELPLQNPRLRPKNTAATFDNDSNIDKTSNSTNTTETVRKNQKREGKDRVPKS